MQGLLTLPMGHPVIIRPNPWLCGPLTGDLKLLESFQDLPHGGAGPGFELETLKG